MSRMYFLCMSTLFGLVRSGLLGGTFLELFPGGFNQDDMEFIISAQRTYCYNSATCQSPLMSFNVNITKLETRLKDQIQIQPAYCCEICTCNDMCCCDTEQQDNQKPSDTLRCMYPQIKAWKFQNNVYPSSQNSYLIKIGCPAPGFHDMNTTNMAIRNKCASYTDDGGFLTAPVFDIKNNITYKNKFCAKCNKRHKQDLVDWDISIECTDGGFQPSALNTLFEALKNTKCNIIYYPHERIETSKCTRLINQCNVTGKWAVYDPVIERACAMYTAPYAKSYENMFCYLCNVNEEKDPINKCIPEQQNPTDAVTFRMLLRPDIAEIKTSPAFDKLGPCVRKTAYDSIQKTCVPAICMSPKVFMGGRCVNVAKRIGGFGYRLFLVMTPQFVAENVTSAAETIEEYVKRWLNENDLLDTLYVLTVHESRQMDTCNGKEDIHLRFVVVHMDLYLSKLKEASNIDNLLGLKNITINTNNFNKSASYNNYFVRFDHFDITFGKRSSDVTLYEATEDGRTPLKQIKEEISFFLPENFNIINLYPTSMCPLIALNNSFYNISLFNWGVFVGLLEARLNKSEYVIADDDYCDVEKCVFVCIERLSMLRANYDMELNLGTAFCFSLMSVTLGVAAAVTGSWF